MLRKAAVRTVKPLVSDAVWERLRTLGRANRNGAGAVPRQRSSAGQRRRRLAAMNLTELAVEYKSTKYRTYRYTPHYERHLGHLRGEQFTLLEIGIGGYAKQRGGRSLKMWYHYFPKAEVVGLDIEDKSFLDRPRIHTYQGSQDDETVLRRIVEERGAPLVVIDDGSHRPAHVLETFRILFPLLPEGAVYAIEDVQTSYWPEFGGSEDRHAPATTMALVKDLVDGLNYEEFVDEDYEPTYTDLNVVAVHAYHNLVLIEKGPNRGGTNKHGVLRKRYADRQA
jgi:demethylmacrocin O-methyltransferase